jgi:hypothetical protein
MLASGNESSIQIGDSETGKILFREESGSYYGSAFSLDGKWLVTIECFAETKPFSLRSSVTVEGAKSGTLAPPAIGIINDGARTVARAGARSNNILQLNQPGFAPGQTVPTGFSFNYHGILDVPTNGLSDDPNTNRSHFFSWSWTNV